MKYERVLAEIYRKPWAILPEKFETICEIAKLRASGEKLSEQEIRARLAPHLKAAARSDPGTYGAVALIGIYGVISHRMNLMSQISGGTSIEKLTAQFRGAMADPTVKAVVFDVDSPGGSVEGVPELADEILKSRGKKKTVAVANSMAASAAYYLASAADELVVIPSGQVGSIGVFSAHEDISAMLEKEGVKISLISAGKYKTDGNPYEPLSDGARADLQQKVDAVYEMFVKAVAKGRGVSQASVREGFGQGRLVMAADALKQKMVDGVATLDATFARLGGAPPQKRMAAASAAPQLSAGDGNPDDPLDPEDPENGDGCECACGSCMLGSCDACTMEACADEACAADGCPMQQQAKAKAALNRRRRELDLH